MGTNFGVINPDTHLFRVVIPPRSGEVTITESYYGDGCTDRVVLPRSKFLLVGDASLCDFNTRLKETKQPTGRWNTDTTLVDRLLGKELCVLAWAIETADNEQTQAICLRWAALRPEERWWLFNMTVAEAGLPQDTQRGWRRALFYALSGQ